MVVHRKQILLSFGQEIPKSESDSIKTQFEAYAKSINLPIAVESRVGESVFYRVQVDDFPQSAVDLKQAIERIVGPSRRVYQKHTSSLSYTVYSRT